MALHLEANTTHSNDREQMTQGHKIKTETQDQSTSSNEDHL